MIGIRYLVFGLDLIFILLNLNKMATFLNIILYNKNKYSIFNSLG